ncbi:MAG: hypothetical protein LBC97_02925 [Bifidobacteriaceae bacterium]|nr:hypothetical protein [Bifidobacteriaceae bacterium]
MVIPISIVPSALVVVIRRPWRIWQHHGMSARSGVAPAYAMPVAFAEWLGTVGRRALVSHDGELASPSNGKGRPRLTLRP